MHAQGKYGLTVGFERLTLRCECADASLTSNRVSWADQTNKPIIMDNQGGTFSFPIMLDTNTSPHTVSFNTTGCMVASVIPADNHKLTFDFGLIDWVAQGLAEDAFAEPYKNKVRTYLVINVNGWMDG
jgi:hypothetical protein